MNSISRSKSPNPLQPSIRQHRREEDEIWVSIEAVLLLGCVHCKGQDSDKAAVFHRIVAPEYCSDITVHDRDVKTAFDFMIVCATILEEMTRDFML